MPARGVHTRWHLYTTGDPLRGRSRCFVYPSSCLLSLRVLMLCERPGTHPFASRPRSDASRAVWLKPPNLTNVRAARSRHEGVHTKLSIREFVSVPTNWALPLLLSSAIPRACHLIALFLLVGS